MVSGAAITWALAFTGCLLETATGKPEPLDPAFTKRPGVEDSYEGAKPFADLEGESVAIKGMITSAVAREITLEFLTPDPDLLGGWKNLGHLSQDAPGEWTLAAPPGFGPIRLEAYQDLNGDGPTSDDLFGWADFEIGGEALIAPQVDLVEGGYREALTDRAGAQPFAELEGDRISLSGELRSDEERVIVLDLRTPDEEGIYQLRGILIVDGPGIWGFSVPARLGTLRIQAYQDQRGDGVGKEDPYGLTEIEVGTEALNQVNLLMLPGAYDTSGGGALPFADATGATVRISGKVAAEQDLPVQIDFKTPVEKTVSPSGFLDNGKLTLVAPGAWSARVPKEHGEILLQAFQDISGDGPSDDDPFGFLRLKVGAETVTGLELPLAVGGKQALAKELGHGGEGEGVACESWEGDTLTVSGEISGGKKAAVSVDFRINDPKAEGGNRQICRQELSEPGPFSYQVGVEVKMLMIEAFQDVDQNGPSEKDPYSDTQLRLKGQDVPNVELKMEVGARKPPGEGAPGGGGPGGGGPEPFLDYEGDWVQLKGNIQSSEGGPVVIDFGAPDPTAPGGKRSLGRKELPDIGAYSVEVPKSQGALILEIFQDLQSDGPSDEDPYAQTQTSVGEGDVTLDLTLVAGARGQPGAGPGGASGGVAAAQAACFADLGEDAVEVFGILRLGEGVDDGLIKVDIFAPDPESTAGRKQICQLQSRSGSYSFEAPRDFGELYISAYIDLESDGPTPGDPRGDYAQNPMRVGGADVQGIHILLEFQEEGDDL